MYYLFYYGLKRKRCEFWACSEICYSWHRKELEKVSLESDGISLVSENIYLTDGHWLARWLLYNCNMFQRGGTMRKKRHDEISQNERWRGTTITARPSWGHQNVDFCISKVFKRMHVTFAIWCDVFHIANACYICNMMWCWIILQM
jgi:hypothetical protein